MRVRERSPNARFTRCLSCATSDGAELVPTLVLAFKDHGRGATERRRIARGGLVLGRGPAVFAEPFDERMSVRQAEIISMTTD